VKFMLDTNAVIAVQRLANERFLKRLRKQRLADVVISSVTLHELYYGAYKSRHVDANLANIAALRFTVLPFDDDAARHTGQIRAALYQQPVGAFDAMIAGHARAQGLVLITHNTREFSRVPQLRLQDWES
jgi:tRNA(fMet)-specific endonuclease VapC